MNYQDNNNRNYSSNRRSAPYDDAPDYGRRYRDEGSVYSGRDSFDPEGETYDQSFDRQYDEGATRIYEGDDRRRSDRGYDDRQRYYDRRQYERGYDDRRRPDQGYDRYPRQEIPRQQYQQIYDGYPRQNAPRQQHQQSYNGYPQQNRPRQQRPRNFDSSYDVNPVNSPRAGRYSEPYNRRDDYQDSFNGGSYGRKRPRGYNNGGYGNGGYPQRGGAQPKKKTGTAIIVVRVVAVLLLLVGGYLIGTKLWSYYNESKDRKKNEGVHSDIGLQGMHDENSDVFGWLDIKNTDTQYVVMYTPYDSEKYLHMAFDGDYSEAGELFMDADCNPNGCHYLIYGHHMNNGSKFGSLPKYEDWDYYQEHKYLSFETLEGVVEYEIFAVFYSQIYEDYEDVFKYYDCADLYSEERYNYYVSNVKSLSVYDTGITPVYGDKIVTLSTCNYHTQDGRFVVCAKSIN